ncbi:hypothetical protein SAMN05660841_04176 [Sphingobacterium nematocida]|uniref:SH3 domain-containing protein n=1 Tax=Sphingobacterium nematocida TaxID=1513896 RepID=A0A1T5GL69_9SPHI|nr:SH3 domain-containing protein [Sphingobacterium nematocida]SKC09152.1 hypothetical protein SAMN05660841_04176 [Sphingobacterium nematocida]
MLKFLTFILLSIFSSTCFAQFAKIIDKDGYTNLREKASATSRIVGKINSEEIVYTFHDDEFGNWRIADYRNEKNELITGYIHKSRLKEIASYEQIPSLLSNRASASFQMKDIQIDIESDDFDYAKHKKDFSISDYGTYSILDRYKGQEMWGTDGTIPQTHYKSIIIQIRNKTIRIPERDIENLFNINNESVGCYYDYEKDCLYIVATNGDGAGGYVVLFKIEKGKYAGKKLEMPF